MELKKFINNFEYYIGGVGLLIMLIITFANVLGRYVFKTSWAFTEELVGAMFILVTLFGAAEGAKTGEHLGLSILTDFIPQKHQKWVIALQQLATFAFAALLIKYGIVMVQSEIAANIRTAALQWPEAIFGSFLSIGGTFLAIRSLQRMVMAFRQDKNQLMKGDEE